MCVYVVCLEGCISAFRGCHKVRHGLTEGEGVNVSGVGYVHLSRLSKCVRNNFTPAKGLAMDWSPQTINI